MENVLDSTCFVDSIEAEVPLLGLARVPGRPHHDPLHVAQPALIVAVVRICQQFVLASIIIMTS